jgi:cytosine/adenosine deaminase-related metal-dependent hydrolase
MPQPPDLIITDCAILDVRTGDITRNQQVVIDNGLIEDIRPATGAHPTASTVIRANGRLLLPGFIDVHSHTEYLLGDSVTVSGSLITNLSMHEDSIAAYRRIFAAAYLPYGVTAVPDMASSEEHMPMLLKWMEPSRTAPDFFPSGGALFSQEAGRTPAPSHSVVRDSVDAIRKIRDLNELGIRHVKLYWRLRQPELAAALTEANGSQHACHGAHRLPSRATHNSH